MVLFLLEVCKSIWLSIWSFSWSVIHTPGPHRVFFFLCSFFFLSVLSLQFSWLWPYLYPVLCNIGQQLWYHWDSERILLVMASLNFSDLCCFYITYTSTICWVSTCTQLYYFFPLYFSCFYVCQNPTLTHTTCCGVLVPTLANIYREKCFHLDFSLSTCGSVRYRTPPWEYFLLELWAGLWVSMNFRFWLCALSLPRLIPTLC